MKINHKQLIFIILITIIGLVLRLIQINTSALWIDELYCFDIASKTNIAEILKTVFSTDLHAPLFFIILHFWIKIFKTSDIALLMLPVLFSTACIPIGYIIAKKLFNIKTAIILSVLTTFSALEIVYAQELKFYSMLPLLGLLSTFCFLEITKNFDIKKALYLLISNIIIIYTFNAGIFFVLAQFVTGLLYIIVKRKENLKCYIYAFIFTGLIYLPYFYFQIKTMLGLNKSICTLFDIFHFDLGFVFSFLQNFFTPAIVNLSNNTLNYNPLTAFKELGFGGFVFYILFFAAITAYGIFKTIKEKNEKCLLILISSVLFIAVLIALALFHIIPLVTRYTLLAHLSLLLAAAYGVSQIKSSKVLYTLAGLFIFITVFNFLFYKDSALKRKSSFHYYSALALKQAGANGNDIIVMPYFGRFLYKYFNKGQLIDYRSEELLLESDAFLMKETFNLSDKEYKTTDKSSLSLQKFIEEKTPPQVLENYIKENYLSKLQNNQKIYLIENYNAYIIPDNLYDPMTKVLNIDNKNLTELEKNARYALLYTKILKNLEIIFSKHLILTKIYNSKEQDVKIFEFVYKK